MNDLLNTLFTEAVSKINAFLASDGFFVCSALIGIFLIVKGARIIFHFLLSASDLNNNGEQENEKEDEGGVGRSL